MMVDLKPCPFCGCAPVVDGDKIVCPERHCWGPIVEHYDSIDDAAEAWNRRPASPSIGRVVVKALEWDGTVAANPFGAYTVTQTGDDDHWSYVWHEYPYGEYTGAFATEDEAKAAAQSDYERRILSALSVKEPANAD